MSDYSRSVDSATSLLVQNETLIFPLSFAQQRLWLLDRLEPNSAVYNIPMPLRLCGPLDHKALEQALSEVVRRHEVLRSCFELNNGSPSQVVHPPAPVDLLVRDLTCFSAPEREEKAKQLALEDAQAPFDLGRGALFRASLLKLTTDEHILLLTIHHIVFDGWSGQLLFRELWTSYRALLAGQNPALPDLPFQYSDYTVWQHQHLSGQRLARQLDYWQKQLAGAPPALLLPTDHPRPARQSYRGAKRSIVLPAALLEQLKQLSQRHGVTLFITLLSAFKLLLSRYTGQDDIVVGSPVTGRNRVELENVIGLFVNTLVLRTDLAENPTFEQLLKRVRETALNAYEHQDVPFEKLVEKLNPERDLSRNPIFQVMFAFQNTSPVYHAVPGLSIVPFQYGDRASSKFDLSVTITEQAEQLRVAFEYSTDLFLEATIARMQQHFSNLVAAVALQPDCRIANLPLMSEDERQQVLFEWNRTAAAYESNLPIHTAFERQVAKTPHEVALLFEGRQITYRELNQRTNQLAHYLIAEGVEPGTRVGVALERSPQLVSAVLAILKIGASYVPLDPNHPKSRLAFLLDDSAVAAVVTDAQNANSLSMSSARLLVLEAEADKIAQQSTDDPSFEVPSDSTAYVIYTSGSTGTPKAVEGTHRAAMNRFTWMWRTYPFEESEVCCHKTTLGFVDSVWEIFGPLLQGVPSVIIPQSTVLDPTQFVRTLAEHRVSRLVLVPSLLRTLLNFDPKLAEKLPHLRWWTSSGEELPADLAQRFCRVFPHARLLNLYGSSEVAADATYHEVTTDDQVTIPIGRPIANTQVYILDRNLKPVPPGIYGHIYVGGDNLARGYWNRPELTAERFIANPIAPEISALLYDTGDLGRYRRDGTLQYAGRSDSQVKVRGVRIELGEIETALKSHPAVQQAAVVLRDIDGEASLAAYVVAKVGAVVSSALLRAHLEQTVPAYMVPLTLTLLKEFPLTPSGKINRRALPEPQREASTGAGPRNEVEDQLLDIWSQVLRVASIGIDDNFFELGGHSLLATQIVSRINTTLHVEVPLAAVFEHPTIAELAKVIDEYRASNRRTTAQLIPRSRERADNIPLSFAQQRLWLLDRIEPNTAAYNLCASLRLSGALQVPALESALTEIVRRHEVLRTVFPFSGSVPHQLISPAQRLQLATFDLTDTPDAMREGEAQHIADREATRPFQLEKGPLFRAALLKLRDDEHVLLLAIHHIVSDGWSQRVLLRELTTLYQDFSLEREPSLPELPVQYADFALWQRQYVAGERLENQLRYWKDRLTGAPTLDLPTDRVRPPVQSFRGAVHTAFIPAKTVEGLKHISRREGATLFMTLLAAFNVLLSRYSGQVDIVVGSPSAGRNCVEIESLIGLFVNTLALRTELHGDPTFAELLAQVRERTLDAYANQDLPFERVVEEINPARDLSRNPIFQVMFILQNMPAQARSIPGLHISPFGRGQQTTSKFDLTLSAAETAEGLRLAFEYSTDLFESDTIGRMQQHFANLLEGVAANPDFKIARLPLLSDSEQRQVRAFSETAAAFDPSVCLHQFFEEQARKTPDAIAAVHGKQELSYQELDRRANQLAWYLRDRGVKPGVPVGICVPRSLNMLVGVLGILKSGGAYVPLDPSYPDLRLACILEDSAPGFVVTEEKLLPKLPSLEVPVTCLDRDWPIISQQPDQEPLPATSSEQLAYILFTSGSTGRPKGVALTHRNASNFVQWAKTVFSSEELSATLFATSLGFDLSIFEMFAPWSVAGKVIVADNILSLRELATADEVTLINTVPSAIAELLRSGRIPSSVKTVNLAGEPLPASLVKDLYALGHVRKAYNLYGPTEATTYSTFTEVKPGEAISIGRPIANTQVYVLDRFLQPVPIGVCGDIYIGGEGVARGYCNHPELTAERFIVNPIAPQISATLYKTGDLGRYLPDGRLQYMGRSDNQVKVRGFRVELGEIEKALEGHAAVQQAAVVLREVAGEPRLAAYILANSDRSTTDEALRAHLQQQFPVYMVPSLFTFVDRFPLTATGKIDRLALPEPGRTELRSTAPRDALESTLLPIWEQVLGVSGLGVTDNFFDHGGHSLLALRLLTEIEKQTGKKIPLSALFQNATVERLANVVRDERKQAHTTVAAVQPEGEYPPFFGIVVPGANPLGFVALARHLGKNQPLFQIQGPGRRVRRPYTPKEFEELAAEYIRSMKTVQPHGPYYFGGMCEGARIAFDMARLLDAEGERVGLLAILDTWVLENSQNRFLWKIGYYRTRARWFLRSSPAAKWRALRDWFHHRVGSSRPELLWPRAYWPGKDFVPAKYSGKITLFKVPKQPFFYVNDPLMGWGTRTTGSVDVQPIESKHLALLREPYVRSLAARLSKCLERARGDSEPKDPSWMTCQTEVPTPSSASQGVGVASGYFGYENQQGLG